MLVYSKKRTPKIIQDRDFLGKLIWKKLNGKGNYIFVADPEDDATSRPHVSGTVRGRFLSAMKISYVDDYNTAVEYVVHLDLGGHVKVPKFLMISYINLSLLKVIEIKQFFQEMRTLEDYDGVDGRELGYTLVYPGGLRRNIAKHRSTSVRAFVKKNAGLNKISIEFPWICDFLEEISKGKLHFNSPVETNLISLSHNEAMTVAKSLSACLRQRKTLQAGIYQWKSQNRSVDELFSRFPWLEDMISVAAQEVRTQTQTFQTRQKRQCH